MPHGRLSRACMSVVAVTCALGATAAQAEQSDEGFNGYVSVGAAAVPDYEGSDNYMPAPFAAGRLGYNEYYVDIRGPMLRANVMPAVLPFGFEFGPALAYRFGRDDVEDDRVEDLRDVDASFAAGAFARVFVGDLLLKGDELGFEVESLTGIGDDRDGTTVSFGPGYSFWPVQRLRLGFKLSATYASDRYNDTYFAVDADNAARSGLDQYAADGGIKDVGFGVNAMYMLTEHWGLTGVVGVKQMVGDAGDSPIVEDAGSATQLMGVAGVSYRF